MTYNLYEGSISTAKAALLSLEHVLKVAEKAPNAATLLDARLIDSMKPLSFQVHMVTSISQDLVSRLMARGQVQYANDFKTFDDVRARITDAIRALDEETDAQVVNEHAEDASPEEMGPLGHQNITNKVFALAVALPNIQFHTIIAYAILRKGGVPLQKSDYIVGFMAEHFRTTELVN